MNWMSALRYCVCVKVLCWLSLSSARLPIKGTPQVVRVGALKPATRTRPLTLPIKSLTRLKYQSSN